ncbi:MAG: GntR family transcriptional regulator [Lachnospiraceae bacterium]|nr:GntR family transcriptional regulator [Lachnospiraceae bacterium]
MAWNLDSDRPIYAQILERIEIQIVSGVYKPGEKIPSVRELAAEAGVNPNTMQRALAELERHGLVSTQRTSGRVVTEDMNMIKETRNMLAKEQIQEFIQRMRELGFEKEEILTLLKSEAGGEKNE